MSTLTQIDARHTELPWRAHKFPMASGHGFVIQAGPSRGISIATLAPGSSTDRIEPVAEANAAFIVRACNAHDELVAALKAARDLIDSQWERMEWRTAGPVGEKIRTALTRAES